ncbi:hypothetical protein JKP88DRAFT_254889 [Tribonema minus]|uniref:Uncharacterized protein n=1 Tax=Tribonema minus TaxID=303371 RepID=A0A835Z5S5_9STRA|nr:hypothetical protein JKP88DRAFT_254889 [Tribonema minus]
MTSTDDSGAAEEVAALKTAAARVASASELAQRIVKVSDARVAREWSAATAALTAAADRHEVSIAKIVLGGVGGDTSVSTALATAEAAAIAAKAAVRCGGSMSLGGAATARALVAAFDDALMQVEHCLAAAHAEGAKRALKARLGHQRSAATAALAAATDRHTGAVARAVIGGNSDDASVATALTAAQAAAEAADAAVRCDGPTSLTGAAAARVLIGTFDDTITEIEQRIAAAHTEGARRVLEAHLAHHRSAATAALAAAADRHNAAVATAVLSGFSSDPAVVLALSEAQAAAVDVDAGVRCGGLKSLRAAAAARVRVDAFDNVIARAEFCIDAARAEGAKRALEARLAQQRSAATALLAAATDRYQLTVGAAVLSGVSGDAAVATALVAAEAAAAARKKLSDAAGAKWAAKEAATVRAAASEAVLRVTVDELQAASAVAAPGNLSAAADVVTAADEAVPSHAAEHLGDIAAATAAAATTDGAAAITAASAAAIASSAVTEDAALSRTAKVLQPADAGAGTPCRLSTVANFPSAQRSQAVDLAAQGGVEHVADAGQRESRRCQRRQPEQRHRGAGNLHHFRRRRRLYRYQHAQEALDGRPNAIQRGAANAPERASGCAPPQELSAVDTLAVAIEQLTRGAAAHSRSSAVMPDVLSAAADVAAAGAAPAECGGVRSAANELVLGVAGGGAGDVTAQLQATLNATLHQAGEMVDGRGAVPAMLPFWVLLCVPVLLLGACLRRWHRRPPTVPGHSGNALTAPMQAPVGSAALASSYGQQAQSQAIVATFGPLPAAAGLAPILLVVETKSNGDVTREVSGLATVLARRMPRCQLFHSAAVDCTLCNGAVCTTWYMFLTLTILLRSSRAAAWARARYRMEATVRRSLAATAARSGALVGRDALSAILAEFNRLWGMAVGLPRRWRRQRPVPLLTNARGLRQLVEGVMRRVEGAPGSSNERRSNALLARVLRQLVEGVVLRPLGALGSRRTRRSDALLNGSAPATAPASPRSGALTPQSTPPGILREAPSLLPPPGDTRNEAPSPLRSPSPTATPAPPHGGALSPTSPRNGAPPPPALHRKLSSPPRPPNKAPSPPPVCGGALSTARGPGGALPPAGANKSPPTRQTPKASVACVNTATSASPAVVQNAPAQLAAAQLDDNRCRAPASGASLSPATAQHRADDTVPSGAAPSHDCDGFVDAGSDVRSGVCVVTEVADAQGTEGDIIAVAAIGVDSAAVSGTAAASGSAA